MKRIKLFEKFDYKEIDKEIEDLIEKSKESKNYNRFINLLSNTDNIKCIKKSNEYHGGYDIIFNTGEIINFNNDDLYDQGGLCMRIIIKRTNEVLYLDYNMDLYEKIQKFYKKTWEE